MDCTTKTKTIGIRKFMMMRQIYEYANKQYPNWITAKDVSEKFNISYATSLKYLKLLTDYGFLERSSRLNEKARWVGIWRVKDEDNSGGRNNRRQNKGIAVGAMC